MQGGTGFLFLNYSEILVKNLNFVQKSKFWSKIQMLVRNPNFGQQSKFWSKNTNVDQKSKFWSKLLVVHCNK